MKHKKITKWLAASLAAAMLVQTAVPQYAVNAQETAAAQETAVPQLQDGTAVIPAGSDAAAVKEILGQALVANADEVDLQSLEWEYYCTGKSGLLTNDAWGSVNGFTSEKKVVLVTTTYTHPALANNSDGSYRVRLAGTDTEVTLTKAAKMSSSIVLNEGCTVNLPYNEDLSINYDRLRENIFNTVAASSEPQLTADDVMIEYRINGRSRESMGSAGGRHGQCAEISGNGRGNVERPHFLRRKRPVLRDVGRDIGDGSRRKICEHDRL